MTRVTQNSSVPSSIVITTVISSYHGIPHEICQKSSVPWCHRHHMWRAIFFNSHANKKTTQYHDAVDNQARAFSFTHTHTLSHTALVHTNAFTTKPCYTLTIFPQARLHTDPFTHKHLTQKVLYTQTLLHTDHCVRKHFCTQMRWHTDTFTYRHFYIYTRTLLHTAAFKPRTCIHTHTRFYTEMRLLTYTQFYTQALFTQVQNAKKSAVPWCCEWHILSYFTMKIHRQIAKKAQYHHATKVQESQHKCRTMLSFSKLKAARVATGRSYCACV